MNKIFRDNGLSIVVLVLFLVFWGGQTFVGKSVYNDDRADRSQAPLSLGQYLQSDHFMEATMENWESEFLQAGCYMLFTAWLYQRGSAESNDPDQADQEASNLTQAAADSKVPWPVKKGGVALVLYANSLCIAFMILFLASFLLHAKGGAGVYSEEQIALGKPAIGMGGYLLTSQFWFESLQNWQSEFLAIASMVILSIFLRQRGSSQSKPVEAPNAQTGG